MNYPYPRLYLKGLDGRAQYRLSMVSGSVTKGTPEVASGDFWMSRGVDVDMRGDFQAASFRLERVK